ncbi:alpha/beta hydrolase [Candidatus Dependentiae bacterium]|nr:alpha/beta hydrolase [Candidatus Dependentiae bacterium]
MDYTFFKTVQCVASVASAFFTASDGVQLAYWHHSPVVDQHKVLVFYHGGGAYQVNAYQQMAKEMAEKHGMGCYLFDIRGHGLSGGARGDAPSVDRVLLDVQEAIAFVRQQNPAAQIFIGGHSSGCGLVMHALQKGCVPNDIAGMIFIAPFLGAQSKLILKNDFVKKVAFWWFVIHSITGLGLHRPAIFFNYPDWLRKQSPMLLDYYTVAMAHAITPEDGDAFLGKISVPLYVIIGKDDKQISSAMLQDWQKQGLLASNTTVTVVPDTGHFSILFAVPGAM